MVLSFSNPLTVVAWFAQLRLNHTQCPYKPRHVLSPHLQGGGQYNQFASPSPVENCGRWVRSSIMLPWASFRAHRTCCYWINQAAVLQGQFGILGNMPSHPRAMAVSPYIHPNPLYLLKDQCQASYLSWSINFCIASGCQCLLSQDAGNSEDCLWGKPKCPSTHPDPQGPTHESPCSPLSRAGTTIRGALSPSVLSVMVPDPQLLESQTYPTQRVALLGTRPEL